jgi:hypothetical protein
MSKKPKSSSPPRSLFISVKTPVRADSVSDLVDYLKSQSSAALIERAIKEIEKAAARGASDQKLTRGPEFAVEIAAHIESLRRARARTAAFFEQNIAMMEAVAARAASAPLLAGGKEFADELTSRIKAVRDELARNDSDRGIWAAMKITEYWMMLRTDAIAAAAVGEKVKRLHAHPPAHTDQHIIAVLGNHDRVVDAAVALESSARAIELQIRRPSQYLRKNAKR